MRKEKTLLCSDTARTATIEQLGDHVANGRLTMTEYDDRAAMALSARTTRDLSAALEFLPTKTRRPLTLFQRFTDARSNLAFFSGWMSMSLMTTVIWGLMSLHRGHVIWFWPSFVIIPWGVLLLVRTVTGTLKPPPRWYYGSKPYDWL